MRYSLQRKLGYLMITTFKIIGNMSGHGIPYGTQIDKVLASSWFRHDTHHQFYWQFNDLELGPWVMTKSDIFQRLDALKEETLELQKQVQWMDETGNLEFNERKFKIYQALKIAREAFKLRGTEEEQAQALNDATTEISKIIG
jgi:hypothetical protein